MGTPSFAVPTLELLYNSELNIVACVTAPDRPAGRGRKIRISDVKAFCIKKQIPVLQPENLKSEDFINDLKQLKIDIIVVVAFRMLPKLVWDIPKKGCMNLHASLLPNYRGAAPINWAIINGESKSGISTFFINEQIDTGDILMQEEIIIDKLDNFETLHDKMKYLGASLVLKTIQNIDNIKAIKQIISSQDIRTAPKLNRENTQIDWSANSKDIVNLIRGLNPYPAAWTQMKKKNGEETNLKIFEASEYNETSFSNNFGTFKSKEKTKLLVQCGKGVILIHKAQISGKKAMRIEEILRGYASDFEEGKFIF